jgi:ribosomal protein S12 methylthiotransferase
MGVKEVMLIAQELTYYGLDIYKKRALPELLKHLSDVEGLQWIRLHYAYPSKFPLEVLDVIRERDNICKYLDMPLQHASDHMLKAMRRQITRAEMTDLIHTIRQRVPGICLRTTLIAGFPGETEKDFEETLGLLDEIQYDSIFSFKYSPRPNTAALQMSDHIPEEEKARRLTIVQERQRSIQIRQNSALIGAVEEVNVEGFHDALGLWVGRTSRNRTLNFTHAGPENEDRGRDLIGKYVHVRVTRGGPNSLAGETVN